MQNIVEGCSARFESQVLFVATGQSALTATPTLQKLTDRFAVQVALSDKDVETVVREVVLRKKPEHVPAAQVDARRGQRRDRPAPRRHPARAEGGRQAGPRSRLPAAADPPALLGAGAARHRPRRQGRACCGRSSGSSTRRPRDVAERPDRARRRRRLHLRASSRRGMLQSGVLLKEIDELIRGLRSEGADGALKSRICALIFLISQMPQPDHRRRDRAASDGAVPRRPPRRGPRRGRRPAPQARARAARRARRRWPAHADRRRVPAPDRRGRRVGEGLPQPPRRHPRRRQRA